MLGMFYEFGASYLHLSSISEVTSKSQGFHHPQQIL